MGAHCPPGRSAPLESPGIVIRILIISDIHYAGPDEQARGAYESRLTTNPLKRALINFYRHYIWHRSPLQSNYLLEKCLDLAGPSDWVVANGDFSCDSAFIGAADPAARASAEICLGILRRRHGDHLFTVFGDHELGKKGLVGGAGGLRIESWHRCVEDLQLRPLWSHQEGRYTLMGVASSLIAFPVLEPEAVPEEVEEWKTLRAAYFRELETLWRGLPRDARIILFCHDPTALPFLWSQEFVRERSSQIEKTIIGHLHSPLILWQSAFLRGMPVIRFMGHSARRISQALHDARVWKYFHLALCPSLAGIELLKDGGYLEMELDPEGREPLRLHRRYLPR